MDTIATTDQQQTAEALAYWPREQQRRRAIAEARRAAGEAVRIAVRRELDRDLLAGRSARGRAGRIQRALRRERIRVSERQVRRILAAEVLCPIRNGNLAP